MAPFRLASPSALFEKSYIYSLKVGSGKLSRREWRTLRFGALVFLATLITAAIAPLSAILIVPQLAWWNVDDAFSSPSKLIQSGDNSGFTYWDMPYDAIWPTSLNSSSFPASGYFNKNDPGCWSSGDCPYFDLNSIMRWGMDSHRMRVQANIPIIEEGDVIRYVTAARLPEIGYSIASAPMSSVSRNLSTMWLWFKQLPVRLANVGRPVITMQPGNDSNPILRPLVQTQCGLPMDATNKSRMVKYAFRTDMASMDYFNNRTMVTLEFPTNKLVLHPKDRPFRSNLTHDLDIVDLDRDYDPTTSVMGPGIEFVNLGGPNETLAIGAAVAIIFGNLGYSRRAIFPCTMVFHWVPSQENIDPDAINVIAVVNNADPQRFLDEPTLPYPSRAITMDASYLQAANIPVADGTGNLYIRWGNAFVFSGNLTLGPFEAIISSMSSFGGNDYANLEDPQWPSLAAMMLSLQSTAGLARFGHHFNMFTWFINATNASMSTSTNLIDLYNPYFLDKNHDNQKVINKPQIIFDHPENYTQVKWQVPRFGYTWSLKSGYRMGANVLKCVALSVVLAHSAIIIIQYIALFIKQIRGDTGRCVRWDTPLDLLLLALQTPEKYTNRLRGTSTKVNDPGTYRDVVRIEESPSVKDVNGCITQSAIMTVNDPRIDGDSAESEQYLIDQGVEMSKVSDT